MAARWLERRGLLPPLLAVILLLVILLWVTSFNRLMLSANVAKVIKSGMALLGIEVPERM